VLAKQDSMHSICTAIHTKVQCGRHAALQHVPGVVTKGPSSLGQ
jgi:hypothetical protein